MNEKVVAESKFSHKKSTSHRQTPRKYNISMKNNTKENKYILNTKSIEDVRLNRRLMQRIKNIQNKPIGSLLSDAINTVEEFGSTMNSQDLELTSKSKINKNKF